MKSQKSRKATTLAARTNRVGLPFKIPCETGRNFATWTTRDKSANKGRKKTRNDIRMSRGEVKTSTALD